jgi:hypothetical protein
MVAPENDVDVANPMATPLAPEDLRRAYADIAHGYNHRLPRIEERIDLMDGHILAAHGLIGRLTERVEEVAKRVGARSRSTPPPPPEPLEIHVSEITQAGQHARVPIAELDRLKGLWLEKEAESRGYKQAIEDLETKNRRSRERWTLLLAVLVPIGVACGWFLEHFVLGKH